MLNTKKFLFIMPDSAFVAEVFPTKKEHTFSTQVFHQIQGEFVNEDELLSEHIQKLLKKIDPDEYQCILPDFLFTNTIVDVYLEDAAAIQQHIHDKLLPSLDLTPETHDISAFVLTQLKGKAKVQLSALEKSLMEPLTEACSTYHVTLTGITPLSWAIKSLVSLEPSLTVVQLGGWLYLAQHYIGVDQTISFPVEEVENVVDTIRTLKGAEPNIQTLYLLTNLLVENELKEALSGTLPIQQLTNYANEQEGMPVYVKQIVEATAKTLDIPEFAVPQFHLDLSNESGVALIQQAKKPVEPESTPTAIPEPEPELEAKPKPEANDAPKEEDMKKADPTIADTDAALPKPNLPAPHAAPTEPTPVAPTAVAPTAVTPAAPVVPVVPVVPNTPIAPAQTPMIANNSLSSAGTAVPKTPPHMIPLSNMNNTPSHNPLSAQTSIPAGMPIAPAMPGSPTAPNTSLPTPPSKPRPVIKNKSGTGSFLKVIGITLAALFVTVGLGVGIGFGLLSYTQHKETLATASPTPSATPETTPEPSIAPTPTPTPTTVAKDKVKILVINATKTPGLAGKLKTTLTTAGYKSIATGNAAGTYASPGNFVLMTTQDQAFISQLGTDSHLSFQYQATKSTEDPKGAYDVVIVLNQ